MKFNWKDKEQWKEAGKLALMFAGLLGILGSEQVSELQAEYPIVIESVFVLIVAIIGLFKSDK